MAQNSLDEFYIWLINECKLTPTHAGSIVSHVRRMLKYNVPIDEDKVRAIMWNKNKYVRRNYVRAMRKYIEYLEWVEMIR